MAGNLEEVVSEVRPQQVEAGHLHRDEQHRVHRRLKGGACPFKKEGLYEPSM